MARGELLSGREKRIASLQRRFKRSRTGAVLQIFLGQLLGAALLVAVAALFIPDELGLDRRGAFVPLDWLVYGFAALIGLWGVFVLSAIKAPPGSENDTP